jgi:transmembrane sensor
VDIRNATAWTRKQIVLDGRKLGEVVQEFNRYGAVPIVVHDPVLARLQLGGVLDAYDTGSFLTFLTRMGGVEVVEGDGQIVVHRLKDGDEGGSPVQP